MIVVEELRTALAAATAEHAAAQAIYAKVFTTDAEPGAKDAAWNAVDDAERAMKRAALELRAAEDEAAAAHRAAIEREREGRRAALETLCQQAGPDYFAAVRPIVAAIADGFGKVDGALAQLERFTDEQREAAEQAQALAGEFGATPPAPVSDLARDLLVVAAAAKCDAVGRIARVLTSPAQRRFVNLLEQRPDVRDAIKTTISSSGIPLAKTGFGELLHPAGEAPPWDSIDRAAWRVAEASL